MTNQAETNNLNYLIDPTFNKVNRLFVLSFENDKDRTTFSKYYTHNVEEKILLYYLMVKVFLMCQYTKSIQKNYWNAQN